MQARSTIKSPVCAECGGSCCRGSSTVLLTRTDVLRIARKTGQSLQRTDDGQLTLPVLTPFDKPDKDRLGGRTVTVIGYLNTNADGARCTFWSKKGCTLGAARPFHCRIFFCDRVLAWAEREAIQADFVPAAVKVLQAVARDEEDVPDHWACREWAREKRARVKALRAQ